MNHIISARGLSYAYAGAPAVLRDADLDLSPGEIVVVTGASGAGKTTLLTLCGALRSLQHGELQILGRDARSLTAEAQRSLRTSIGFIFQSHHLLDALSASQNVAMSLMNRVDLSTTSIRSEAALNALGLGSRVDALPGALSGGEKQRVAVARALVRDPHLLLADEPTASLDDHSADCVKASLAAAVNRGNAAALIVTHDARLFDIADRILRLESGVLSDMRRARPGGRERLHSVATREVA
jgi:putative ABC transport system ATP-binding protein